MAATRRGRPRHTTGVRALRSSLSRRFPQHPRRRERDRQRPVIAPLASDRPREAAVGARGTVAVARAQAGAVVDGLADAGAVPDGAGGGVDAVDPVDPVEADRLDRRAVTARAAALGAPLALAQQ